MTCVYCGAHVDPTRAGSWYELAGGWAQRRKGGGAHGVHNPVESGRYACESCMALKRRGIAIQQGHLW